jgi:hypothetical protein
MQSKDEDQEKMNAKKLSESYEPKLKLDNMLRDFESRNNIQPPEPNKLDRYIKHRMRRLF